MERLTNTVLQHAQRQPDGEPVLAKWLLHLGNRAAVDQALSRLVRMPHSGSTSFYLTPQIPLIRGTLRGYASVLDLLQNISESEV